MARRAGYDQRRKNLRSSDHGGRGRALRDAEDHRDPESQQHQRQAELLGVVAEHRTDLGLDQHPPERSAPGGDEDDQTGALDGFFGGLGQFAQAHALVRRQHVERRCSRQDQG